jgi:hypothetical protein
MPKHKKKKLKIETESRPVPRHQFTLLYWILLIFILFFSGLLRYRLLDVPLERDEGEYAYAGQLILQGVPPYLEVYNMKMPGIYGIYAFLMALFGQTIQGIHTGLLVINSVTIVLVFLLGKYLLNPLAAVFSAGIFAIMSLSQSVQGVFANAEHFVIIFSLAGLLMLIKAPANKSHLKLFAAGVFLFIGFIMKQHGMMFCFLAVFYIILDDILQKPFLWKSLAGRMLPLTAGLAAAFAGLLLIMLLCGVFRQFWFWTVVYARAYVSQVPFADAGKYFMDSFSKIFASAPLLWILAGLGIVLIPVTKQISRSHKFFLLLFVLFSFLSICPGFFFRPHYFILLLPCAAILCGTAVYIFTNWLLYIIPKGLCYGISVFIITTGIGLSIYKQADYMFHMTTLEVCHSTYGFNPFSESLPIAEYIRNHTKPEDTIAILGSEPQICFYSQRRSASGYIYMYPLMEQHKFALQMQKDFIAETETKKPKYIIYNDIPTSWLQTKNSNTHLFDWLFPYLQANYQMVGTIELFNDTSAYHWLPQLKWPVSSQYSVIVFERNIEH